MYEYEYHSISTSSSVYTSTILSVSLLAVGDASGDLVTPINNVTEVHI